MVLWWQWAAGMNGWGRMQATMEMTALTHPLHKRHCGSRGCRASSSASPLVCLSHLVDHQHTQQHQHAVVSPPSTSTPSIESTAKPQPFPTIACRLRPRPRHCPCCCGEWGAGQVGAGQGGGAARGGAAGKGVRDHILSNISLVQDIVLVVVVMISSRSVDDGPVVAM